MLKAITTAIRDRLFKIRMQERAIQQAVQSCR